MRCIALPGVAWLGHLRLPGSRRISLATVLFASLAFASTPAEAVCNAGTTNNPGTLLAVNPAGLKNSTSPADVAANEALLATLSGRPAGSVHFIERIDGPGTTCVDGVEIDAIANNPKSTGFWQADSVTPINVCFVVVKAGAIPSGGGAAVYQYAGAGAMSGSWTTALLGNKDISHIDFYRCDAGGPPGGGGNNTPPDDPLKKVTDLFVHRRVDNLLNHGPDRARVLRRLEEQDAPPKHEPLKFHEVLGFGWLGFGSTAAPNPAMASGEEMSGPPSAIDRFRFARGAAGLLGPDHGGLGSALATAGQDGNQDGASSTIGRELRFSMSLSQLRDMAHAAELASNQKKLKDAGLSFGEMAPTLTPRMGLRSGLDVWVEGQISHYEDGLAGFNRDGRFGILYAGADYALTPWALVGALVQFDWTDEQVKSPVTGTVGGRGWMAGPYLGIKLHPNVLFDARVAWGTSDNDILISDPVLGQHAASFQTTRWIATATLTGNYHHGAWRFTPQLGISYADETYDDFTSNLGQTVHSHGISIGRGTLGQEIGYRIRTTDGVLVEPHVGVTGIWNFDSDDVVINDVVVDSGRSRARVEGGVIVRQPAGMSLRAAVSYDGVGVSDFHAVGGRVWLNIPLN